MASLEPVPGFSRPGANFQVNRFTGGEDSRDVVLDMSFLTGGLLHYSVERLDGGIMESTKLRVGPGQSKLEIHMASYPVGIYTIHLEQEGFERSLTLKRTGAAEQPISLRKKSQ
ncbi:MAG: hypothetical protein HKN16_01075 [Saprospiraceae bacterium]|nr:hypothetical protein [Saprospiraceae bacterium]